MTAEEILQNGELVETKYHYFSPAAEQAQDPTNRVPYEYVYELNGERATYTFGWTGGETDWYFTGINEVKKV